MGGGEPLSKEIGHFMLIFFVPFLKSTEMYFVFTKDYFHQGFLLAFNEVDDL